MASNNKWIQGNLHVSDDIYEDGHSLSETYAAKSHDHTSMVHKSGTETITGNKTFTGISKFNNNAEFNYVNIKSNWDSYGEINSKKAIQNHGIILKGTIDLHPEGDPVIFPYYMNDLAYLIKKGGSCVVKYKPENGTNWSTISSVNIDSLFDGTSSYTGYTVNSLNDTVVIVIKAHKTFSFNTRVGISSGSAHWRAKNIQIDMGYMTDTSNFDSIVDTLINAEADESGLTTTSVTTTKTWVTRARATDYAYGTYFSVANGPMINGTPSWNIIRITLTNFNNTRSEADITAGKPNNNRFAGVFALCFDSEGLNTTLLGRKGGKMYGNIVPYTHDTLQLGESGNRFKIGYFRNILENEYLESNYITTNGFMPKNGNGVGHIGSTDVKWNQVHSQYIYGDTLCENNIKLENKYAKELKVNLGRNTELNDKTMCCSFLTLTFPNPWNTFYFNLTVKDSESRYFNSEYFIRGRASDINTTLVCEIQNIYSTNYQKDRWNIFAVQNGNTMTFYLKTVNARYCTPDIFISKYSFGAIQIETKAGTWTETIPAETWTELTNALDSRYVQKVSNTHDWAAQVYGIGNDGTQKMWNVATTTAGYTIPYRHENGQLSVGTPTAKEHAATKEYVDNVKKIALGITRSYYVENMASLQLTEKSTGFYQSLLSEIPIFNEATGLFDKTIPTADLKIGDVLLVKALNEPDFFVVVSGNSGFMVSVLETDLDKYEGLMLKTDSELLAMGLMYKIAGVDVNPQTATSKEQSFFGNMISLMKNGYNVPGFYLQYGTLSTFLRLNFAALDGEGDLSFDAMDTASNQCVAYGINYDAGAKIITFNKKDTNYAENLWDPSTNKSYSYSDISNLFDSKAGTAVATTSANGLMSKDDKTKLNGIQGGATKVDASTTNGKIKINGTETTVYTHPGSGTNPHGTTKTDVGLGNVGNFKAVSTVASQGLTDTEKSNARANIGAGTSNFTGYTASNKLSTSYIQNDAKWTSNAGTVTSVRVQATSPVVSSSNTAQTSSLNTTISLADGYGDTKNPYGPKTKNWVLAAPNGSAGVPSFRALVAADIPSLPSNRITAMTGYSKASSASTIKATDSLNTAIGKLEKALDGKGTSNLTLGTTATTAAAGNHTHKYAGASIEGGAATMAMSTYGGCNFTDIMYENKNALTFDGSETITVTAHNVGAVPVKMANDSTKSEIQMATNALTMNSVSLADDGTASYIRLKPSRAEFYCDKAGLNITASGTNILKLYSITAPTSSGGTTYGLGTSGQVLKSNGTSVYWANDNNTTYTTFTRGSTDFSPAYTLTAKDAGFIHTWWRCSSNLYASCNFGKVIAVSATNLFPMQKYSPGTNTSNQTTAYQKSVSSGSGSYSNNSSNAFQIPQRGDMVIDQYGCIGVIESDPTTVVSTYSVRLVWKSIKDWSCLEKGTQITLADGTYKNIEDVRQGESIMGWDFEKNEPCEAIALFADAAQADEKTTYLVLDNGEILSMTDGHTLYSKNLERYIPINDLREGDILMGKDGEDVEVVSIHWNVHTFGIRQFYHIVSSNNTYFANNTLNAIHPVDKYNWLQNRSSEVVPDEILTIFEQDKGEFDCFDFTIKNKEFLALTSKHQSTLKKHRNKIGDLKNYLTNTDYVAIKMFEGLEVDETILDIRKEKRKEINALEKEIEKIEKEYNSLLVQYSDLGEDMLLSDNARRSKYFKVACKNDNEHLDLFKKYYPLKDEAYILKEIEEGKANRPITEVIEEEESE